MAAPWTEEFNVLHQLTLMQTPPLFHALMTTYLHKTCLPAQTFYCSPDLLSPSAAFVCVRLCSYTLQVSCVIVYLAYLCVCL